VIDLLRSLANLLTPGSRPFLLVSLGIGIGLLFAPPRAARWGRRWLLVLLALYATLSLQGTSDLLVSSLAVSQEPIRTASDAPAVEVLVVLSNGANDVGDGGARRATVNLQSGFNAVEGARLYRLLAEPLVIVSGGRATGRGPGPPESQALAAALERRGVPAAAIVQESSSRTTREQAVNVGRLLQGRDGRRFVLVTVPEHMRRAVGVFRALGFDPIPAPSPLQYGGRPFWRPTFYALRGSAGAIHEYLALAFYKLQGWI
jgi:uncharacterized SAM-binding protein YcdF (DUF218 family)